MLRKPFKLEKEHTGIMDSSTDRPYKTCKIVFTAGDKNVRLQARSVFTRGFPCQRFQRALYQYFKTKPPVDTQPT